MKAIPEEIGWFVRLRKISWWSLSLPTFKRAIGEISLNKHGKSIASKSFSISVSASPVPMPWGIDIGEMPADTEIHLSFDVPKGHSVELLVHKALDRSKLLKRAIGHGIEIGPGPRPQVIESKTTTVRYLEEMPIEKWAELYDPTGKYGTPEADFSRYIIGTADNLPAADGSLNFMALAVELHGELRPIRTGPV